MTAPGAPWLSVITVVRNDATGFTSTLASMDEQDLDGVEFIVIDGSDATQRVDEAMAGRVATTYEWHPPTGVYRAMNAGLAAARGEYVYFLNAGDVLTSPTVLSSIRGAMSTTSPPWLFGSVRFIDEAGRAVVPPPFDYAAEKRALFSHGRFPPHQGTVARSELLRQQGGFDTSYRIGADYAAFLRLSLVADPVECSCVIAEFRQGGLSSTSWRESLSEFHRARRDILAPRGWPAVAETSATWLQIMKVGAYRSLWAPGRPGAAVAQRFHRA
jgi:glycosyltransferase involved in cell wall biosynthesis